MKRKKKLFVRPKKPFESIRIGEENEILKKYALKNKREIWKTLANVNYFRTRAKDLARASQEEQEVFFNKLKAIGLNVNSIADVLDLRIENILERRLSTIVAKKKLASTPNQARQMIVHKRVFVNNKVINVPSYLVPIAFEEGIKVKEVKNTKPIAVESAAGEAV